MSEIAGRLRAFLEENGVDYERIHHHRDYTAMETAAHTHTPGNLVFEARNNLRVTTPCIDESAEGRGIICLVRVGDIRSMVMGTERLKDGGAFLQEADANPGNRIHVDDLVRCCIAALDQRSPAGIYNVGDGDHQSATSFAQEVARQAGLPEPRLISRAQAEKEFSPVRLAFMSSSRIVDTGRMREVLGVTPRYTNPVDGIAASL